MEEYVAQQHPFSHTGNQGPILDTSGDHAQLDSAATSSSARIAAGHVGTTGTTAPWMADDTSTDHAWFDGAVTTCSIQDAAGHLETSGTITLRVANDIVPEMARKEMPRCLWQPPLLVDISADDSEMDQEPARRRKNGKPLKSSKVRTADSTVIKWITWPHELVYTSGGEPMTYELISMSQFVTDYLSVLDVVKAGEKK